MNKQTNCAKLISLKTLFAVFLLFWAVSFTFAAFSDMFGALKHLGIIEWKNLTNSGYVDFKSLILGSGLPFFIPPIAFTLVVFWSLVNGILFWTALFSINKPNQIWLNKARIAYIVSLIYWPIFLWGFQILLGYGYDGKTAVYVNHMAQWHFELVTFAFTLLFKNEEEMQ